MFTAVLNRLTQPFCYMTLGIVKQNIFPCDVPLKPINFCSFVLCYCTEKRYAANKQMNMKTSKQAYIIHANKFTYNKFLLFCTQLLYRKAIGGKRNDMKTSKQAHIMHANKFTNNKFLFFCIQLLYGKAIGGETNMKTSKEAYMFMRTDHKHLVLFLENMWLRRIFRDCCLQLY